ncbi:hypothetical protein [Clostridium sp.]|uniref:hypothetical protein n=1 Tax=Clostridium sp. TaxID=1506 RepID=UPI003D6CE8D0
MIVTIKFNKKSGILLLIKGMINNDDEQLFSQNIVDNISYDVGKRFASYKKLLSSITKIKNQQVKQLALIGLRMVTQKALLL